MEDIYFTDQNHSQLENLSLELAGFYVAHPPALSICEGSLT